MKQILPSGQKKLLLMIFYAGLSAMVPQYAFSQSGNLTFSKENATLKEIIGEIKRVSQFDFVYSDEDIAGTPRRMVDFRNAAIVNVLGEVLNGTGLNYQIDGNVIVLRRGATQNQGVKRVSGIVTDQAKRPLPGTTITVKGTSVATATDAEGKYTFNIPAGDQILIFSNVAMETLEIALGAQATTMNVTMKEKVSALDAVIVTGMFNKSRESYTGAVTEISEKEVQMFRGQNLIRTIANIDPSFALTLDNQYGSDPNRIPDITIRGSSSLPRSLRDLNSSTASRINAPLIIMNGIETTLTRLMDFNDEDIKNITILKDASATAMYGSRGANGVIVIETKRPTQGQLRINFRIGLDAEIPDLSSYNLLDAEDKLELERVVGLYDSKSYISYQRLKGKYMAIKKDIQSGVNTDWLSQPLRTGMGQRYNFRMDWGSEEFQITAALGYLNKLGVMKGSQRNTFNGALTIFYKYKGLIFSNEIQVNQNNSYNGTYGDFSDYVVMNPYWRIHDDTGQLIKKYETLNGNQVGNPLYNATRNIKDESRYEVLTNNFAIDWTIIDGLILRGTLGLTKGNNYTDRFLPPSHTDFTTDQYLEDSGQLRRGSYTYTTRESSSINTQITLSFNRVFAEKHMIFAGFNFSMNQSKDYSLYFFAEGYTNDIYDYFPNALQYKEGTKPSGNESTVRSVGFTGNINYTYDNRYFVDGSYRLDGSSLYGNKKRFAPFWSIGLGWNIHNEAILQDNKIIDRLRIRGSVGETGSQQFSAYQALPTMKGMAGKKYLSWTGAHLMGFGNEKLKWQTTLKFNVGFDLTFLDNRIEINADIYRNITKDLLSEMQIQLATGYQSYVENIGKVMNRGFEASVSGHIIRNTEKELYWNVTAKIAYNKNEIVKLSDAIKQLNAEYLKTNTEQVRLLYEGHSIDAIYAVPSLGIDPSTGREVFLDKDNNVTYIWNPNARRFYGISQPPYRGNISTQFSYKNLSLSFSFAYHWGGQQDNRTLRDRVEVSNQTLQLNVDRRAFEERWHKPGDVKYFKGYGQGLSSRYSSRFVMDDNVLQLQTISMDYRVNSQWLKDMGINSMRIGANMSDIFYISSIKRERGTSYPFSRRADLSLSITF